jgi:hypothetical protein
VIGALVAALAAPAGAVTLSIMIGDDDGFAGTQVATCGADCDPGDAYNPGPHAGLNLAPSLVPYVNQTDVETQDPWTPYTFQYQFDFDTTGLASVTSATVTVQAGSVALRDSGAGFGPADVSADVGGPSMPLGDFLTVSTGGTGSPAEETVRAHVFAVTSLIDAGETGTLTLTIDGSGLTAPVDLFGLDFAVLSIEGTAVPEPGTLALFGSAAALLSLRSLRRSGRRARV